MTGLEEALMRLNKTQPGITKKRFLWKSYLVSMKQIF